jgi:hypothetical protein
MKITQSEKLKRVLAVGTLCHEKSYGNGKIKLGFVPNQVGMEMGIPPLSQNVSSPFELIDVIFMDYLDETSRM